MAQKKSKTLKSLKKKVKKIQKYNILKRIINSSVFLVLLLVLSTIQLIQLWKNKDNESLFLFVLIAFIVYNRFKTKNMIYVLGIPFVVINILTYLRSLFRVEPFIGQDASDNEIRNICNTIDIKNDSEDDCIKKIKSLSIQDIADNLMSQYTAADTENELKNFIRKEISDISSTKIYQEQENVFNKEIIKLITDISGDSEFKTEYAKIYQEEENAFNKEIIKRITDISGESEFKTEYEDEIKDFGMNIISSNADNNEVKNVINKMLNRLNNKITENTSANNNTDPAKNFFTNIFNNIYNNIDNNVDDTQSMNT